MPSFPTAIKVALYLIDGSLYERVKQADAVRNPAAIRAVVGDKIAWLTPANLPAPEAAK